MFDDIYRQTANEETADHFHHTMNNVHPILKFEMEKPETTPNSLSLSLLDFTISKDGNSSFEFLKKKKKKKKKTSQETVICPSSISYTQEIQNQLHSQRAEKHRGQVLLTDISNAAPKHIR